MRVKTATLREWPLQPARIPATKQKQNAATGEDGASERLGLSCALYGEQGGRGGKGRGSETFRNIVSSNRIPGAPFFALLSLGSPSVSAHLPAPHGPSPSERLCELYEPHAPPGIANTRSYYRRDPRNLPPTTDLSERRLALSAATFPTPLLARRAVPSAPRTRTHYPSRTYLGARPTRRPLIRLRLAPLSAVKSRRWRQSSHQRPKANAVTAISRF